MSKEKNLLSGGIASRQWYGSILLRAVQTRKPFVASNANWVTVSFEYPRTALGWAIYAYQKYQGCNFPRLVHCHFSLDNGERYDRCWNQTLLGIANDYRNPVDNCIRVLVPTPYSNESLALRALDFLVINGETKFDCSRFVAYCLGTVDKADTPSELFEELLPYYYDAIRKLRDHTQDNSGGTITPTQNDASTRSIDSRGDG